MAVAGDNAWANIYAEEWHVGLRSALLGDIQQRAAALPVHVEQRCRAHGKRNQQFCKKELISPNFKVLRGSRLRFPDVTPRPFAEFIKTHVWDSDKSKKDFCSATFTNFPIPFSTALFNEGHTRLDWATYQRTHRRHDFLDARWAHNSKPHNSSWPSIWRKEEGVIMCRCWCVFYNVCLCIPYVVFPHMYLMCNFVTIYISTFMYVRTLFAFRFPFVMNKHILYVRILHLNWKITFIFYPNFNVGETRVNRVPKYLRVAPPNWEKFLRKNSEINVFGKRRKF